MPYKSKAQSRFMHWRHPEIAKRWDKEIKKGDVKKLPERVSHENPVSGSVIAIFTTAVGVGLGLLFYELFTKARASV